MYEIFFKDLTTLSTDNCYNLQRYLIWRNYVIQRSSFTRAQTEI